MVPPSGKSLPDFRFERKYWVQQRLVAGVDEAGRGCVAGPIVAAAVVAAPDSRRAGFWQQVNDSKQIGPRRRQELVAAITEGVLGYAVSWVSASAVDELGIDRANQWVMEKAILDLPVRVDRILADWIAAWPLRLPDFGQERVVKGDGKSLSIAAASILAKVHRDAYMVTAADRFPQYGFGQHKGYLTRYHAQALSELGPCPEHRRSFRPLAERLDRSDHAAD